MEYNKYRMEKSMFENKNELEAREEILGIVDEYCKKYHNQKSIRKGTEFLMQAAYMTARK